MCDARVQILFDIAIHNNKISMMTKMTKSVTWYDEVAQNKKIHTSSNVWLQKDPARLAKVFGKCIMQAELQHEAMKDNKLLKQQDLEKEMAEKRVFIEKLIVHAPENDELIEKDMAQAEAQQRALGS
jgi:hypothetical protein